MADDQHRPTLWLVEDSPLQADRARQLLGTDYQVELFEDGPQVLERLTAGGPLPLVLVLDLLLPSVSGLEVCEFVRARWDRNALPVLLLTSRGDKDSIVAGFNAGANDYVGKPFDPGELKARVDALAHLGRLHARAEAAERTREQARAELLLERERLWALFMHAPAAVCLLRGPDHRCEFANSRFMELIGGGPLVGRTLREARPDLAERGVFETLDEVRATGEAYVAEAVPTRVMVRGCPKELFLKVIYEPSRSASGDITGVHIFAFEVTEQVVGRRKLEELLSVASHELRTPLTSIQLQLQMLRRRGLDAPGALGAPVSKALDLIQRQVRRQTSMIVDLLDVSRLSGGRITLEPEEVDVAALAADVVGRFEPESAQVGAALTLESPEALSARVDPSRFDQVVTNLVSNALKYGRSSPVEVRLEPVGTRRLRLRVQDRGIGIAPEDLHRVFVAFERVVPQRSYAGLGLGLWITRRIVEAMGGTISVESRLGEGSTFTVELPRTQESLSEAKGANP